MKAKATYSVKSWNEKTLNQISQEQKITYASVEYAFAGDIQGKASVEYVMYYTHVDPQDPHRATATYTGIVHFSGQVSGKDGSFGMTDQGVFENGAAKSDLQIIQGSGQGELGSIHGKASYHADQKGFVFELEYEL